MTVYLQHWAVRNWIRTQGWSVSGDITPVVALALPPASILNLWAVPSHVWRDAMLSAHQVAPIHRYLQENWLHRLQSHFCSHIHCFNPSGQVLDEVLRKCVEPSQCQVCVHNGERISHGKQFIINHEDPHLCQIWYAMPHIVFISITHYSMQIVEFRSNVISKFKK